MEAKTLFLTLQIGKRILHIGKNYPYRLTGISGIEASEYAVVLSENALLDGAYIDSKRVQPRLIDLSFVVPDMLNSEAYRRLLISFFTPKSTGTLKVERSGVSRKIEFELQTVQFQQATLYDILTVNLSLICPDPYFRDGNEHIREMIDYIPLLTFPFNSYHKAGVTAGLQKKIDTLEIENTGDTEIGIIADLIADGGVVSNPSLSANGQYVKVLDIMQIDDTIKISTEPGNKRIEKNGASYFKFDRQSIFFTLPVGISTVTITADLHPENMSATLTYSLKYLGI